MKRWLFYSLNGALGLVFLLSACFKLLAVEIFELNLVDTGFLSWTIAPYAARSIIAVELLLGLFFVCQVALRKFTIPFAICILFIFTVYLLGLFIRKGNSSDCNCFGKLIELSPLQSLLKNIVLILLSFLAWKYADRHVWKKETWLAGILIITSFAIPYIGFPLKAVEFENELPTAVRYKLDLDPLYSHTTAQKPSTELRKGKQVIACLSLTCSHCKIAAYKLHLIKMKNPRIPVNFLLNGKVARLPRFIHETRASDIPRSMVYGADFLNLTRGQVPAIYFVENGYVVKKVNYLQVDQNDIEAWLNR
jgi:hypothetical protein